MMLAGLAMRLPRNSLNALLMLSFVATKSAVTILLDDCVAGGGGHHFIFQTLLLLPFLLQILFYSGQTCLAMGWRTGLQTLRDAHRTMLPAVFYSLMVSLSMLLQTLGQSYLDAGTFVVLMQLTLVFVALGEQFVLKRPSTWSVRILIGLQVFFVSCYQLAGPTKNLAATAESAADDRPCTAVGVALCLAAGACSALGNILQQRFMQSASSGVPASVKLCYQHAIGFALLLTTTVARPSTRDALLNQGFWHGWDATVLLTSLVMWLSFLAASSVTAFISAMAGAMGSAVVVVVVGAYGVFFRGHVLSPTQEFCVLAIAGVTVAYAHLKGAAAGRPDKRENDSPSCSPELEPGLPGSGQALRRGGGKVFGRVLGRSRAGHELEPYIV